MTVERDFTAFYSQWHAPLRKGVALAVGNLALADEAVDEAMTRALDRWEQIRDYDRPEGWVYRVAVNWARGVFRKQKYEVLTDAAPEPPGRDLVPLDTDVVAAVGRLSLKLRSIVVARYYLDWSTADVATAFSLPEGTVKSRLARALARLAKDLGETS